MRAQHSHHHSKTGHSTIKITGSVNSSQATTVQNKLDKDSQDILIQKSQEVKQKANMFP